MVSLKSNFDRQNLMDVPTYTRMIGIIEKINDKLWIKTALATILATGARVSEVLYLKRGHIKFLDYGGKELSLDKLTLHDTAIIQFNLFTEKNKKVKYRIVPLIKNELFLPLVEIIVDYCREFQYDESLLFPYTRQALWFAIKRNISKDMYCHYMRHTAMTNDARAGINSTILRSKFGWSDERPGTVYTHLNTKDLINAQKEAYGTSTPLKLEVIEATEKAAIVKAIDETTYQRNQYDEKRNYIPEPVKESNAVLKEQTSHPEAVKNLSTDEQINKLVKAVNSLPEFKETKPIESEPVNIDNIPVPEPRKKSEPLFVPTGIPKRDEPQQNPVTIKPEGADLFTEGQIVKDRLIIVDHNKQRVEEIRKKVDPRRYIVLHQNSQAIKTKIERGIPLTPPNWKKNLKNQAIDKKNLEDSILSVV